MHCFNESAPLANIFDCMKGHNRKLNRLRERGGNNGGGAVKKQDRFFLEREGRQGWAAGVSVNPRGYGVMVPRLVPPFTQHPTVHNRPRN